MPADAWRERVSIDAEEIGTGLTICDSTRRAGHEPIRETVL